jgi:hypothetical protein
MFTGVARPNESLFETEHFGSIGGQGSGRTSTGTGGPGTGAPGTGSGTGGPGTGSGAGTVNGAGSHRGGVPTASPGIGAAGSGLGAGVHSPDLQSAVAGQMAAAAGTPAAATPGVAAGTGTGLSGGDTARGPMRRFGMDTIGSGQWFGDAPEAVGASPSRSRYSRDERVTEQVSIDGEEHNLPPTVIGDS